MTDKQIRASFREWRKLRLDILARVATGTPSRQSWATFWNERVDTVIDFRTDDVVFLTR